MRFPLLLALLLTLAACSDGNGDTIERSETSVPAEPVAAAEPAPDPSSGAGMSADSMVVAEERLREALERYRRLADEGGWPELPSGDLVEIGDTAATQVQALRDRLAASDALGEAAPRGDVYATELAGAVAAFQRRHRIAVDSLLGPNTREALNMPVERRIEQIERALERWQALPPIPDGPGSRYVLVNVPEFRVRAFEDGEEALHMKVVVGENYNDRATPLFQDTMDHVIFRPYWNVPPGIAEEELVPKGPEQLAEDGFRIVSYYGPDAPVYDMTAANLQRVARGDLRLQQKPGPENALGLVKYMFPNQHAVYLHDTPAEQLFAYADRTFSHGCIRLERPAEFGAWVLGPQGWDEERVRKNMTSGDWQQVQLDATIPVYIVYLTVFADEDGTVHFHEDIYDEYAEA